VDSQLVNPPSNHQDNLPASHLGNPQVNLPLIPHNLLRNPLSSLVVNHHVNQVYNHLDNQLHNLHFNLADNLLYNLVDNQPLNPPSNHRDNHPANHQVNLLDNLHYNQAGNQHPNLHLNQADSRLPNLVPSHHLNHLLYLQINLLHFLLTQQVNPPCSHQNLRQLNPLDNLPETPLYNHHQDLPLNRALNQALYHQHSPRGKIFI
jgi:hypothetical protein